MILNGAAILFILGVWVSYKLACWVGEPARDETTNHDADAVAIFGGPAAPEIRRQP